MAWNPNLEPRRIAEEDIENLLERIHQELSAEYLTKHFVVPYETARETFQPRTARGGYDEVEAEIERFVEHVSIRVFTRESSWNRVKWPESLTPEDTKRLWWILGDWRALGPEIERDGFRGLLDRATQILTRQAIDAHIEVGLLQSIKALWPPDRLELARRYLEKLKAQFPEMELTQPVMFEVYWVEILREHSQASLAARKRKGWNWYAESNEP